MIKFPYGISDFYKISTEAYFYIDRTPYLRLLEDMGPQLLFLRPRRFGKSLLLSLLENYYDLAKAAEFERLFGKLAIGQQPTALHNSYFVMRWDFSVISALGDAAAIQQSIYDHLNDQIRNFAIYYQAYLPTPIEINLENALSSFASALTAVRQTPYHLYLLIDEYDNFANEVLMSSLGEGRRRYEELVQGEGIFKTVFKAVKAASSGQGLDRVFITGVSPVVMADISSGYNVAKNAYPRRELNHLCGFTEPEISQILQQIAQSRHFTEEQATDALQVMRAFYNGYCFNAEADEPVYNPTLALYFLEALQENGVYPDEMLDSNLAMDRARLFYVARLGGAKALITAALNEQEPLTVTTLAQRFGIAEILSGKKKSTEYLAALLYYLGVLTLDRRTALRKLVLRIPNLVVRELYVERLREILLPDVDDQETAQQAAEIFFVTGDLQPLCDFVERRLFLAYDNRDYLTANELTIKTAFLTLLFNDRLYMVDSETAIQRTYADITLIRRPDLRDEPGLLDLILEFKYVKLSEVNLDGVAARQLSHTELLALPAIQTQLAAARTQLQGYQNALQQQYGAILRLRTYAVVALGFERVAWVEV